MLTLRSQYPNFRALEIEALEIEVEEDDTERYRLVLIGSPLCNQDKLLDQAHKKQTSKRSLFIPNLSYDQFSKDPSLIGKMFGNARHNKAHSRRQQGPHQRLTLS